MINIFREYNEETAIFFYLKSIYLNDIIAQTMIKNLT